MSMLISRPIKPETAVKAEAEAAAKEKKPKKKAAPKK